MRVCPAWSKLLIWPGSPFEVYCALLLYVSLLVGCGLRQEGGRGGSRNHVGRIEYCSFFWLFFWVAGRSTVGVAILTSLTHSLAHSPTYSHPHSLTHARTRSLTLCPGWKVIYRVGVAILTKAHKSGELLTHDSKRLFPALFLPLLATWTTSLALIC